MRYEKSEAQKDAEAAEAQPLEERDLGQAIADHRALYRDDLAAMLRLHARDGDDAGLGPPFNPVFAGFLSAVSDEQGGKERFPRSVAWHRAWYYLNHQVCRKDHKEHWEPEWFGSLCARLVFLVICMDMPLPDAMAKLGLTKEGKTRRTLDNALLAIEEQLRVQSKIDRDARADRRRPPEEWMAEPHEHRHPPNTSLEDCTNAVCRLRRAA